MGDHGKESNTQFTHPEHHPSFFFLKPFQVRNGSSIVGQPPDRK